MSNKIVREIILGANIKKLRKKNNLSQQDLANNMMQTKSTVGHWETGTSHPTLKKLDEIARFFGISLDDLVYNPNVEGYTSDMKLNNLEDEVNELRSALERANILIEKPADLPKKKRKQDSNS